MLVRTSSTCNQTISEWISRALACGALVFTTGCSLFGLNKAEPVLSRQRVYFAEFEDVERAMKQAMSRYPQRVDNPDAGYYETDWIKGDLRFKPAQMTDAFGDGYRYRLIVRIVRGKSSVKPAIKLTISKQAFTQRDFFAKDEEMASDGVEENVILYRITRELQLDKALRRAQEKSNKKSNEEFKKDL